VLQVCLDSFEINILLEFISWFQGRPLRFSWDFIAFWTSVFSTPILFPLTAYDFCGSWSSWSSFYLLVLDKSWLTWINLSWKEIYFLFLHEFVQVVRELQYSKSGVTVKTEDGCVYEANYVILSVSIGVLQSDLLSFNPPLPVRLLFILLFSFPFCLHSHEPRVIKHT